MSVPRQIGPYPVIKKLDEGGFGEVFLAKQPNLGGRPVCIKRAHAHKPDHDDERFLAMFLAETDLVAKLSHENIVSVIDAGQDEAGKPYIVMEYVKGTNATRLLRQLRPQALPADDVAYIVVMVAQALAYAHHEGIIHRDVKPANVLLGFAGPVKLADFGIAKIQQAGQYAATSTESFIGSPPYMAPELLAITADSVRFDHRVDLWALGVMTWELLCGFRPFEDAALGTRPDLSNQEWAKVNARHDPPRRRSIHDVAPDAPEVLRDVIEGLLQPLEARTHTADEVAGRLIESGLGLPTHRRRFVRHFVKDTIPEREGYRPDEAEPAGTGPMTAELPAGASVASPPLAEPAASAARESPGGRGAALQAGDRFGEWVVVRKLGAGGMAIVYEATRTRSLGTQRAALKVIRPEHSESPEFLARFRTEAEIALRLNHQNIVHVLDAGEVEGVHFIAMEFVEGRDLDSLARAVGGRLPAPLVAFIGYEMAQALACAHARGVVHRDISPCNTMLSDDGAVKVNDWGIAKPISADGMVSRTTHAIGKPHYMPPEQLGGQPLDGRADLFAAGVTLFELLAGATPYALRGAPGESIHMVVKRIFENDRPGVREVAPDTPHALAEAIELLLQPALANRMHSADELVRRLEPLVQVQAKRHVAALVRGAELSPELRGSLDATNGPSATPRTLELPSASQPSVPALPSERDVSTHVEAPRSSRSFLLAIVALLALAAVGLGAFALVTFWPSADTQAGGAAPATPEARVPRVESSDPPLLVGAPPPTPVPPEAGSELAAEVSPAEDGANAPSEDLPRGEEHPPVSVRAPAAPRSGVRRGPERAPIQPAPLQGSPAEPAGRRRPAGSGGSHNGDRGFGF